MTLVTDPACPVSIGWDVRGWRSRDQAAAVAVWSDGGIDWVGFAPKFQFSPGEPLTLASLVSHVVGEHSATIGTAPNIVVAIDAPLAFPRAFRELLTTTVSTPIPPATEIDSALAYRDCERWVADQFGKKPLSAPFDKLGNNATLAIALANALRREAFRLVPQDARDHDRAIIEVYPGIVKRRPTRGARAIEPVDALIPRDLVPGTDIYDAAICAILGLVYRLQPGALGLPSLVGPAQGMGTDEGWIYGLPAAFVMDRQQRGR